MEMNATEFRRTLFQTLDRAIQGEPVAITYKKARLRLVAGDGGAKLARAVRRNALVVDPDSIIRSDVELMRDFEQQWSTEDKAS
jgi:antitoxin (DNA-binding transcriptional repressor) of toxin-antitoxin stability system